MARIPMMFYPPKVSTNPILTADPILVKKSALSPESTIAKFKKFGISLKPDTIIPPCGPVNANSMGSQIGGAGNAGVNYVGGYGNLPYGQFPFGESIEKKPKYLAYKKYADQINEIFV